MGTKKNLTELQSLNLKNNQLVGQLPQGLSNLTQLREIRLQGNDLTGWIPEQLAALVPQSDGTGGKLEQLFLHDNGFTGCIPIGLEGPVDAAEKERRENAIGERWWQKQIELDQDVKEVLQQVPIISSYEPDDPFGIDNVAVGILEKTGIINDPAVRLLKHFLAPSYGLGLPPCAPSAPARKEEKPWKPASEQSYRTDRETLMYICLHHFGSSCPDDWGTHLPLQDWYGVHTELRQVGGSENWRNCRDPEKDCRVTRLVLAGKNLTGKIPPELGNLGELKVLNLSKNSLTGKIPPELGNLRNLYSLALNNNNLTGNIPPVLGNLGGRLDDLSLFSGIDNVLDLHLQENRLTGEIPQELSNVGYLRTVLVDPQRDAKGNEYELEGCLKSSEALDFIKSVQIVAFDFVYDKISVKIGKITKENFKASTPYQNARKAEQDRVVAEVDYDDVFLDNQVRIAAGHRFDAAMDEMYREYSKASGFADALAKVKEQIKEKVQEIVLNLGGAGDFEDVACD